MPLEEQINGLEEDIAQVGRVVRLTEPLLRKAAKFEPLPADLEKVHGALRSARDLAKHDQLQGAEALIRQAQEALRAVRQWLAVGELGISPFALRTFLEKNPPEPDLLKAFIRYLLAKQPRSETDRDKLDYLLTLYLAPEPALAEPAAANRRDELREAVADLFAGLTPEGPFSGVGEVTLHELESLMASLEDFQEFDQLVQARLVERVRALKTNLGPEFYHPRILVTVIRFNHLFRRRFEALFHQQLDQRRQETRELIEEAWELVRAIEAAYESLVLPAGAAVSAAHPAEERPPGSASGPLQQSSHASDERPPINRLAGRVQEKQKEPELRGIVHRLARFLEKLPPDQVAAERVVFRLRQGELELQRWEREAFASAATAAAPESTRTIQQALGLMAWMEEELARYQQTREERYLWKTYLDSLRAAVARTRDLLASIRELLHQDAPCGEAAWFGSLLHTALHLGTTLNRVRSVFAEP